MEEEGSYIDMIVKETSGKFFAVRMFLTQFRLRSTFFISFRLVINVRSLYHSDCYRCMFFIYIIRIGDQRSVDNEGLIEIASLPFIKSMNVFTVEVIMCSSTMRAFIY